MASKSITIPVENMEDELWRLLEQLQLGETITLTNAEGIPLAIMVSLKPTTSEPKPASDWDALARQVSQAWQSEKSG